MKLYKSIMAKYAPAGAKVTDGLYIYGMAKAYTFVQALKAAGPNPTRAGLMKAVLNMNDKTNPFLLPGVVTKTGPNDYFPISQQQLISSTTARGRRSAPHRHAAEGLAASLARGGGRRRPPPGAPEQCRPTAAAPQILRYARVMRSRSTRPVGVGVTRGRGRPGLGGAAQRLSQAPVGGVPERYTRLLGQTPGRPRFTVLPVQDDGTRGMPGDAACFGNTADLELALTQNLPTVLAASRETRELVRRGRSVNYEQSLFFGQVDGHRRSTAPCTRTSPTSRRSGEREPRAAASIRSRRPPPRRSRRPASRRLADQRPSAVSASSGHALLEAGRVRVLGGELAADEPAVDRLAEDGRLPERERLEPGERLDLAAALLDVALDELPRGTGSRASAVTGDVPSGFASPPGSL